MNIYVCIHAHMHVTHTTVKRKLKAHLWSRKGTCMNTYIHAKIHTDHTYRSYMHIIRTYIYICRYTHRYINTYISGHINVRSKRCLEQVTECHVCHNSYIYIHTNIYGYIAHRVDATSLHRFVCDCCKAYAYTGACVTDGF